MNNVVCPHCHHSFELTEAFRHQVEEQILTDIRKQHAVELAVKEKALRESQEQELKLRKVKNELDEEKRVWELEKIRQMDTEKKRVSRFPAASGRSIGTGSGTALVPKFSGR